MTVGTPESSLKKEVSVQVWPQPTCEFVYAMLCLMQNPNMLRTLYLTYIQVPCQITHVLKISKGEA